MTIFTTNLLHPPRIIDQVPKTQRLLAQVFPRIGIGIGDGSYRKLNFIVASIDIGDRGAIFWDVPLSSFMVGLVATQGNFQVGTHPFWREIL